MVLAVGEDGTHINGRVTGQNARRQCLPDTGVDGRDVFLRNFAAADLVEEFVTATGASVLKCDGDFGVLARTTRLLLVGVGRVFDGLRNRFAVGHLWLTDGRVDLELTEHAVDEHLEMQFAHSGDDGLRSVFVGTNLEGRIFFGEREESLGHLVLIGLGLGLNRDVDNGFGEDELFEYEWSRRITQRVAGLRVLESDTSNDVTSKRSIEILAIVCMHLEETTDALLRCGACIHHLSALFERAAVHAEVDELANVGVGHDLERKRGERRIV
ncbi:unannotated protein [freshwater metagenome]|uniref:Unannotated protein n=1 Tax=freshwater metagenome TaxID=449393 RepID=A0A6J6RA87_9ZZZZ